MGKFIDLPDDIKVGTEVWVSDCMEYPYCWLKKQYYVGTLEGKVFTIGDKGDECACGWRRAKLPEVNWNEVPIGTRIRFKDEGEVAYNIGYLAAVVKDVPYCTLCNLTAFDKNKGKGNPVLFSYDYVELIEEEN